MSRVKLIAVGDICLQTKNNKNPFEMVKKYFKDKDILFGNLETVLSNCGRKAEKAALLHVSSDKVRYLKDAMFDILNVANNHIMDLGLEGFNETLGVLNINNLKFIGAGNQRFKQSYIIIEKENLKFGFLGYSEGRVKYTKEEVFINAIDEDKIEDKIINDIKKLKSQQCDIIVISIHWSIENVFYPSPKQIKLARNTIKDGATLVLGHHPHVVQGIEKYKNGLIVYSLGNFQFNTNLREKTRKSIILSVEISKNGIEDYEIIPVRINEDFLPCTMDNKSNQQILSFIDTISHPIIKNKINEK